MDEQKLSPWVLPLAGAATATTAGLLGGINIDEWQSMEPKEKAKKLLKCLVMGGVVGLGAEGVRQGYNTVKKRALEKPASYKKSLLSYMMKKALGEPTTEPDGGTPGADPPEKSFGESTIMGLPSHLFVGGGLGLAGGLTLYHFLTDKKKKKPTGYIGAGLGGLLTGVLGAGLFKGFSAKEKNVDSNLYKRDTPTTTQQTATLFGTRNYFVGAPKLKLSPEQATRINQLDHFYLTSGINAPDAKTAEENLIADYRAAIPELTNEQIANHLGFLNTAYNTYKINLLAATTDLNKDPRWTAVDPRSRLNAIQQAQRWLTKQQQKYDRDFNYGVTLARYDADDSYANWIRSNGNTLAARIINHYAPEYKDLYEDHPVAWFLQRRDQLLEKHPQMVAALDRLSQNLGRLYYYNNGIPLYKGNTLTYDGKTSKPLITQYDEDNIRLKYQHMSPTEFWRSEVQPIAQSSLYMPPDYIPNERVIAQSEALRKLWYDPAVKEDQRLAKQKEILALIANEINASNGLPGSMFLSDPADAGTEIDNGGYKYKVDSPATPTPGYKGYPRLSSIGSTGTIISNLREKGIDFSNLRWKPTSTTYSYGTTIAYAPLPHGMAIIAYKDKDGVIKFDYKNDIYSEYNTRTRAELGGKSFNDLVNYPMSDGAGSVYTFGDKLIYKDNVTGNFKIIKEPAAYVEAAVSHGQIPPGTKVIKSEIYPSNRRVCTLSDGSTLTINLITGRYSIKPKATTTATP